MNFLSNMYLMRLKSVNRPIRMTKMNQHLSIWRRVQSSQALDFTLLSEEEDDYAKLLLFYLK